MANLTRLPAPRLPATAGGSQPEAAIRHFIVGNWLANQDLPFDSLISGKLPIPSIAGIDALTLGRPFRGNEIMASQNRSTFIIIEVLRRSYGIDAGQELA